MAGKESAGVRAVSEWLSGRRTDEVPRTVRDAIDRYLAHLRRLGRSPKTIRAYGLWLRSLEKFVLFRGGPGLAQVRGVDLEAWQDELLNKGLAPKSRAQAATAAKSWLSWADDRQWVDPRLPKAVTTVKVAPGMPKPIDQASLKRLSAFLAAKEPPEAFCPREPTRRLLWRRDRALWFFLLCTGARITEALSVRRSDLGGRLVVRQKGGRQKVLWMPDRVMQLVGEYLELRTDAVDWLWVSHVRGREPRHLADDSARGAWRRMAALAGFERWTNHQLRHSCATYLHAMGIPVLDIAQHLGHRDLATVMNYVRVAEDAQRQKLEVLDGLFFVPDIEDKAPGRPVAIRASRPDVRRRGSPDNSS